MSLQTLRSRVSNLYAAEKHVEARHVLSQLKQLGDQASGWWEYTLMTASALGDTSGVFDAISALESNPQALARALDVAYANARKHGHAELARQMARRAGEVLPDSVHFRMINLFDALHHGDSSSAQLRQLTAQPLPLAIINTDVLRRLIRALNQAGFAEDATRLLDYIAQKRPPANLDEQRLQIELALYLRHWQLAWRSSQGSSDAIMRHYHGLACLCLLDWRGLSCTAHQASEWPSLLLSQPQWCPPIPFLLLMMPEYSNATHRLLARRTASTYVPPASMLVVAHSRPATRPVRLRVAYLSGDFKRHPTSQMLAPVLERHDRKRFEWLALDNAREDGSEQRQRTLRAFDRVVSVRHLNAAELAQTIRQAGVDVLVDLSGHTTDNRLDALALHPAPVQITWLGFAGGVGGGLVDYLITDTVCAPEGADSDFDEALIRLPVSDRPGGEYPACVTPPSRLTQGLPECALVLACFNQHAKISEASFVSWCALLRAVPNSVLWLADEGPVNRQTLEAAAQRQGVTPDCLFWANRLPHAAHLQRIACADLILDTHPYNMHTTAVDALAAGVPYLTFCGETLAGRVSASLLHTAGLSDCVCTGPEEYLQRMTKLATNARQREHLRQRFHSARATSPLFDSRQMASYLEQAYDAAYGQWVSGSRPAAISILAAHTTSGTAIKTADL